MSNNIVVNHNLIGWSAGTSFTAASSASNGTGQTTRCADMTATAVKYCGNVHVTKADWLGETWVDLRVSNPGDITQSDGQMQLRHLIDGADYAPLISCDVTISVKVAASVPGRYCIAARNNGLDRSYIHEFDIDESLVPQTLIFTMPAPTPDGNWSTALGTEGLRVQFVMAAGTDLIGVKGWNDGDMKLATSGQINLSLIDNARFRYTDLRIGSGCEMPENPTLSACEQARAAAVQAERNKFYYNPPIDRRL